jgi:hypothetical protein
MGLPLQDDAASARQRSTASIGPALRRLLVARQSQFDAIARSEQRVAVIGCNLSCARWRHRLSPRPPLRLAQSGVLGSVG